MRTPVVLHSISSFDQNVLESSADAVLQGLSRCIASAGSLRSEIIVSPDFWSIVQRLHNQPDSSAMVFALLQDMINSKPCAITADNYEAAVSLANDFANVAKVGLIDERRRDALVRKQKGVKLDKVTYVVL
jgi:golgi-specific brefeldin A-resistance guanine nucleotide exchange factor 1